MPPLTTFALRAPIYRRPAEPGDRDFILATRRAGFAAYVDWQDAAQGELLDRELAASPYEIIEEHGEPIGYRCVVVHDDHVFLDELAVIPDARERGIGTQLVRDVMEAAEARGLVVRLSVLARNQRARDLYERLGFWITAVEPPRVKMEWIPAPPDAVFDHPDEEAGLLTAVVAGDERAIHLALTKLFIYADGAVWGELDGIIALRFTATAPTELVVEGQVYPFTAGPDPFRITLALRDDRSAIDWLTLRWGDARRGLHSGRSPEGIRDWLYRIDKSRIIAR